MGLRRQTQKFDARKNRDTGIHWKHPAAQGHGCRTTVRPYRAYWAARADAQSKP
jgi:hypothetical protein